MIGKTSNNIPSNEKNWICLYVTLQYPKRMIVLQCIVWLIAAKQIDKNVFVPNCSLVQHCTRCRLNLVLQEKVAQQPIFLSALPARLPALRRQSTAICVALILAAHLRRTVLLLILSRSNFHRSITPLMSLGHLRARQQEI